MTDQVECNCAWNPDSHAETCPVYMQQQIKALRQHKTDYMESAEATRRALEADIARLKGMLEAAQDHAVNAQHHALDMGQRALRAALHSCAKASSAAEVGLIVDDALAATPAPEVRQEAVPEETPHIIVFDDADRPDEKFSGAGARPAALRRWEQISVSWNAHLFVRVERNSRDDPYPCARLATNVNRIPAGLYAELEALRTLRDATGVYLQGYMLDEIEDEENCVSVDQHDSACTVKLALDKARARALEWKGGDK